MFFCTIHFETFSTVSEHKAVLWLAEIYLYQSYTIVVRWPSQVITWALKYHWTCPIYWLSNLVCSAETIIPQTGVWRTPVGSSQAYMSIRLSFSMYICLVVRANFWQSQTRPVITCRAWGRRPRVQIPWVAVQYIRPSVRPSVRLSVHLYGQPQAFLWFVHLY